MVCARSVRQAERSDDCRLNDMVMTFGDIYCCHFAPAVLRSPSILTFVVTVLECDDNAGDLGEERQVERA